MTELRFHDQKSGSGSAVQVLAPVTRRSPGRNLDSVSNQISCWGRSAAGDGHRPVKHPVAPVAHVVEDCTSTRLLHCHFLQRLGFETTSSATAEAAIERCKQQRFDLLLMDVSLPDMNGVEAVLRMHRDDSVLCPRQVVFCSGYEADTVSLSAVKHSFLSKPVSRQQLGRHLNPCKLVAQA